MEKYKKKTWRNQKSIIEKIYKKSNRKILKAGADPGFEKGGFYLVPKSDTGGATSTYL